MEVTILLFYIYIIVGLILVATHTLFFYALVRQKTLLKRYYVILSQFVANLVFGIALLLAGIGRLIVHYMHLKNLTSRRVCMLVPWNLLAIWSAPMGAVSLLMVSTDRLIAVTFPLMYYKKYCSIAVGEIIFWNGLMMILVVISWCLSWPHTEPIVEPYCWTTDSQVSVMAIIFMFVTALSSVVSVVLYIVAFIMTRRNVAVARMAQHDHRARTAFEQRQRKLTATMGIVCIVTVIFYVFPACLYLGLFFGPRNDYTNLIVLYSSISCSTNPLSNLIVLLIMQEDIRTAIFSCLPDCLKAYLVKKMPKIVSLNTIENPRSIAPGNDHKITTVFTPVTQLHGKRSIRSKAYDSSRFLPVNRRQS